jgi:hypothetical protein
VVEGCRCTHPEIRLLGSPSSGDAASAHRLKRWLAARLAYVDGIRLRAAITRDAMITTRPGGVDRVVGVETASGSGVQRPLRKCPTFGPPTFGQEAAAGSIASPDVEPDVSVAVGTEAFPPSGGTGLLALRVLPMISFCFERSS